MGVRLKRLRDQVVVITGASSGIGLTTARMAARRGARLVVAARSGDELERLAAEIRAAGSDAVPVTCDVSHEADVRDLADAAVQYFGGFDTWVNNAGVDIIGRIEDGTTDDYRRLFEVNFWGVVYGSLAAVRVLRQRGGALINMGSVASDRTFPLHAVYSASKHAVKGFTDGMRLELEKDGAPVSVSLVKPTAIATPLTRHAGNYLPDYPTLPPPVYAPELAAEAILHCAEHPTRDIFVGDAAKVMASAAAAAPRLTDRMQEAMMFEQQHTGWPPPPDRKGILYHPSHDLNEYGEYPRHIFKTSLYNEAKMHPLATGASLLGAGLALGAVIALLKDGGHS